MDVLAGLLVMPEYETLGDDANAAKAEPKQHVEVVIGLSGDDSSFLLELGQGDIDRPAPNEYAQTDYEEIGAEAGSDPNHMFVEILCIHQHARDYANYNYCPKYEDVVQREKEQIAQAKSDLEANPTCERRCLQYLIAFQSPG